MFPGPPLDCYRDQPKPVPPEIDELDEDEAIPLDEDALVCRRCGAAITTQTFARAVDGRHLHTFFNPAGLLYEIGCFEQAPGCVDSGRPTGTFSWFVGYRWRYSHCAGCGVHLGWQFCASEGRVFWGLIRNRLAEHSSND